MAQNTYLYYDETSKEAALIDAGCSDADVSAIVAFSSENNLTITRILITHGHYDHIISANKLRELTGAEICCHADEKQVLENTELSLSALHNSPFTVTPDILFNDGDVFNIAQAQIKTIHTPGHTIGGVCYYDEKNGKLFTGDTLFKENIGRTDLPTGNHRTLIDSVNKKLLTLPNETEVYPGHGPSTTVGHEHQVA